MGEVVGDGVRLIFDYGLYSWPLNPGDDVAHLHTVTYETIGSSEAKLIAPKGDSRGYTGVYFENLGGLKFNLVGENLTQEQQQTALVIFRSIRSLDQ